MVDIDCSSMGSCKSGQPPKYDLFRKILKKMGKKTRNSNLQFFLDWFKRVLPNPQATSLAVLLVVGSVFVLTLSDMLLPVFAAGVIAYLLEGIVTVGQRTLLSRMTSVLIVYSIFFAFVVFILITLLPLLSQQIAEFVQQTPNMVNRVQGLLAELPKKYPNIINAQQINDIGNAISQELIDYGKGLLSTSAASLVSLITLTVYLILVPLLIFFFLKDKDKIIYWLVQYLPRESHLSARVWREVDIQIGNYVRGKFLEVLILGFVSYIVFASQGLNYSLLLSVLMGLSVIIPYVGATLVTFPVLIVAYFQWGLNEGFAWITASYAIVQTLDGALLVPLLFSEVVGLHPVAIIVAILFFGGLWGFWGVFFAIPLATLVQAVLVAWPSIHEEEDEVEG